MNQEQFQSSSSRLYQRLSILRWLVLIFGLFVVFLHQFLEGTVRQSPLFNWESIEVFYGVFITLMTWIIITWLRYSVGKTETAEHSLKQTLAERNQANEHLELILGVNHRLSEAEDESPLW